MVKHVKDDRLTVKMGDTPIYDIIYSDSFDKLSAGIEALDRSYNRICIVTDSNVGPLYSEQVKSSLSSICDMILIHELPAGEENKTLDTVRHILEDLLENGFTRTDAVIAVGGGVVTDLAGFLAGTFGRGVPFINYATTLLAAADAHNTFIAV